VRCSRLIPRAQDISAYHPGGVISSAIQTLQERILPCLSKENDLQSAWSERFSSRCLSYTTLSKHPPFWLFSDHGFCSFGQSGSLVRCMCRTAIGLRREQLSEDTSPKTAFKFRKHTSPTAFGSRRFLLAVCRNCCCRGRYDGAHAAYQFVFLDEEDERHTRMSVCQTAFALLSCAATDTALQTEHPLRASLR
jgi:hypothetical protein